MAGDMRSTYGYLDTCNLALPGLQLSNRSSWDSRKSAGGRRSPRNSSESLRNCWNNKLKVTSPHPLKLRTEQRGRTIEQQFIQKVQEMILEDEKKRIHMAQGLPWTTDKPETQQLLCASSSRQISPSAGQALEAVLHRTP